MIILSRNINAFECCLIAITRSILDAISVVKEETRTFFRFPASILVKKKEFWPAVKSSAALHGIRGGKEQTKQTTPLHRSKFKMHKPTN